jgi:CRISPR-associated endonuclease Csn1
MHDALVIACVKQNAYQLFKQFKCKRSKDKTVKFELKIKFALKRNRIQMGIIMEFQSHGRPLPKKLVISCCKLLLVKNTRVINKTVNKYQSYKDENGNLNIGKNGKPLKINN